MNEVLRQLYARKSVRVFEDREISPEDKALILRAAAEAPTAGNQQLYTIIDVTDQALKDALAESCDHQPFIARAKLVLVFCADPLKWMDAYLDAGCDPRPMDVGNLILAMSDANIAAQNAVTAAWSLGIGSCYIGDILENRETQKRLLNLPDGVVPAAMLVFGYPTAQQLARPKPPRADMPCIVHENAYRRMDGPALRALLRHNIGEANYEEKLRAFCNRKYQSDFAREMGRSVAAYLKEFSDH